jgi:preprotein translocase subunit SecB
MLQIKPIKFTALELEIGVLDQLDLQLNGKNLSLSVSATKASDSVVTIQLFLKLDLGNNVGMRVIYAVDFSVDSPEQEEFKVTESTIEDTFIQVNAPAIAYPFLRAFVATICVNAGYKPLMLPAVNFQAIFNERKANSEPLSAKITVTHG